MIEREEDTKNAKTAMGKVNVAFDSTPGVRGLALGCAERRLQSSPSPKKLGRTVSTVMPASTNQVALAGVRATLRGNLARALMRDSGYRIGTFQGARVESRVKTHGLTSSYNTLANKNAQFVCTLC